VISANNLLAAFARPASIHTHTLDSQHLFAEARLLPLTEFSEPQVSRRGLFTTLGKVIQQRATEVIENLPEQPAGPLPVEQRLPSRLPPSRKHLNEHLAELLSVSPAQLPDDDELPAADIPYGQVQIDTALCSGCNLCARFCPTGALTFTAATTEVDAETPAPFTLTFQTNLCLDCDICVIACPEDALSLAESIPGEAIRHPQPQTLMAADLVPCANCGVPTHPLASDAPALCYICRARPNTPTHANLIDDLLDKLT
jgi:ferredoxin